MKEERKCLLDFLASNKEACQKKADEAGPYYYTAIYRADSGEIICGHLRIGSHTGKEQISVPSSSTGYTVEDAIERG